MRTIISQEGIFFHSFFLLGTPLALPKCFSILIGKNVASTTHDASDLLYLSHELFGIEVEHACRYSDTGLLKENIRNLDINYNPLKPLALVVSAKQDRFNTFGLPEYLKNLKSLTRGYKLFIFEANHEEDFYSAVEKIGSLYGFDDKRKPIKPISLVINGGHGTGFSTCYGKTILDDKDSFTFKELLEYEESFLDLSDEEELRRLAKYFGVDCQFIHASCYAGKDKEAGNNMVNMTAKALPHISRAYGPLGSEPIEQFIFDEKGLVVHVKFKHWDEGYNLDLKLGKAIPSPWEEDKQKTRDNMEKSDFKLEDLLSP